ncbi:hypothetical protein C8N35_1011155 [Breoghania corrubedonensis]|uniref:Uncharacterized protein n=1 Tax=Breoghania corrubedonensis TaxID=665038 RepID=A0A2T5VH73_9HYPH|nr:hypothetical protein [Breoghania corrubedonensis]PTW63105.1 hypothetical protein C8N35_1011155 [Breoghania corrubedonensis]
MTDVPEGWQVYKGKGVEGKTREERAARLKKRFSSVSDHSLPKQRRPIGRSMRQVALVALIALLVVAAWKTMPGGSPF